MQDNEDRRGRELIDSECREDNEARTRSTDEYVRDMVDSTYRIK